MPSVTLQSFSGSPAIAGDPCTGMHSDILTETQSSHQSKADSSFFRMHKSLPSSIKELYTRIESIYLVMSPLHHKQGKFSTPMTPKATLLRADWRGYQIRNAIAAMQKAGRMRKLCKKTTRRHPCRHPGCIYWYNTSNYPSSRD